MYRKIISALLLLITLTSLIPTTSAQVDITHNLTPTSLARVSAPLNLIPTASANTEIQRDPKCVEADRTFWTGLGSFVTANIMWGASFLLLDMTVSWLETLKIWGFAFGGIFEPLDQAINFMRNMWMQALIWGVIASFFNIFAGWLIEAGIALNLTLTAGNPLVSYGGPIILQIANFGLVLSIIIVGIATILRIERDKYSADKLLIKLIVGIILVNLTIPIATSIAHVGTVVTEAMFRASAPCPQNITHQFYAWQLYRQFQVMLGVRDPALIRARIDVQQRSEQIREGTRQITYVNPGVLALEQRLRREEDAYLRNTTDPDRIAARRQATETKLREGIRSIHNAGAAAAPTIEESDRREEAIRVDTEAALYRHTHNLPVPDPHAQSTTTPEPETTTNQETVQDDSIEQQVEQNILEQIRAVEDLQDKERKRLEREAGRMGPQASGFRRIITNISLDLLALIAAGVMSFIAGFTFLLLALFLLIRFVVLMLLLVFSPLIWLGFIFPDLKVGQFGNIWKAWWSEFLRWTFFGPIIVLFLAFTSQYLNTIGMGAGSVNVLVQLGQLIAVIIIAAIGIYATSKMGGIAGNMVMSAASGGFNAVANASQGVFKRAQIASQMQAAKARAAGDHNKAKLLESKAKMYGSGMIGGSTTNALKAIGIKPQIKTLTDQEARKQVIENQAQMLERSAISIGSYKTTPWLSHPEKALNFKEEDLKGLSQEGREKLTNTARHLRKNVNSLQPKQVLALNQLEKSLSSDLVNLIAKDPDLLTNPATVLALANSNFRNEDINNLPADIKEKVVSAIYNTQRQHTINPSVFSSHQTSSLRTLEKSFASELANITMKDVSPSSSFVLGTPLSAHDRANIASMLQLTNASASEIIRNGTGEVIEKGVQALLALNNDVNSSPSGTYSREEFNKIQSLRRNFDEKITNHIVNNLDPLTNPESIFSLSKNNLSQISRTGTEADRKKIEESLIQILRYPMNSKETAEWARVDAAVNVLKRKGNW